MIRLFLTLYLLILVSFIVAIESLDPLTNSLFAHSTDEIEFKLSQGTFSLLDRAIKGLDKQQIAAKVTEYRSVFHPSFDRVERASIDFNKAELEKLDKGETVFKEEISSEGEELSSIHYHPSLNTSSVWKVFMDIDGETNNITTEVTGGKFIEGLFYMIEEVLSKTQQEQWSQTMIDMQSIHPIPIHLVSLQDIVPKDIDSQLRYQFENNKAINTTQGQRYTTFVRKINNSQYGLQAGPIEIPWSLYYIGYLVYAFLALTIASAIFFWIKSLWKNLERIKSAAEDFGAGKYDTRIPHSKRSRLAGLAHAFNAMAEKTEQSIRSHQELTTAVSHELRTPVARMRFSLDMLASSEDANDNKRYINNMNTDIDEMNSLLEELLSYARFQQDRVRLDIRQQALIPWLKESIQSLMKLIHGKKLTWNTKNISANEVASFEPELMTRVLNNLVQNAVRYAQSQVEVNLTKSDNHYILQVDDDGMGIPEVDRKRLFEVFATLDSSRNKEAEGFGLGLAIVKRIVDRHQGSVVIEDSPLGGARFVVQWPIKLP